MRSRGDTKESGCPEHPGTPARTPVLSSGIPKPEEEPFRAQRGSPAICVSRSKTRPQAIRPREISPPRQAYAASLPSLVYCRLDFLYL